MHSRPLKVKRLSYIFCIGPNDSSFNEQLSRFFIGWMTKSWGMDQNDPLYRHRCRDVASQKRLCHSRTNSEVSDRLALCP
jgi:hypothetical protein